MSASFISYLSDMNPQFTGVLSPTHMRTQLRMFVFLRNLSVHSEYSPAVHHSQATQEGNFSHIFEILIKSTRTQICTGRLLLLSWSIKLHPREVY